MTNANNDEVLVSSGGLFSSARVKAYANRIEVSYPRVLTFGLTRRVETYSYRQIEGVERSGGTVTIKLGTLSVRRFSVGRANAKKIVELIQQAM